MKMNKESKEYRKRVIGHIELLGSPSAQREYERDVPIANVPSELVCGFVNDLYHPKTELFLDAFTEQELRALAELYGMICVANKEFERIGCRSVSDIQKVKEWRSVIAFSKNLAVELKGNG